MNTRRENARRVEEENVNQRVPQGNQAPQSNQAPVDPSAMSNDEVKSTFQMLAHPLEAQANSYIGHHVNPNMSTVASRLRDFGRMNPHEFLGSKVEEDPQRFIDEVSKYLMLWGCLRRRRRS